MYAELHLPIFKQGDDLRHFLKETTTNKDAFLNYAECLREAANMVEAAGVAIDGEDIEVEADTHHIGISGPDDVILSLIESKVFSKSPFDDEDEDEDEFADVADDEE